MLIIIITITITILMMIMIAIMLTKLPWQYLSRMLEVDVEISP